MPRGVPAPFKRANVIDCKHKHVSGRRCAVRVPKDLLLCDNHRYGLCFECQSMLTAFEPPNGWPKGTGDF